MASPEIRRRLLKQRRLILYQLLLEQHAGLEGVQVKHALAEAVNGEDRRFVHLTLRRQQQRSGLREILNLLQQKRQHRIAARAAHAGQAQLVNIFADAPAQFSGGGLGKGHHQYFFHRQRTAVAVFVAQP